VTQIKMFTLPFVKNAKPSGTQGIARFWKCKHHKAGNQQKCLHYFLGIKPNPLGHKRLQDYKNVNTKTG